MITIRHTHADGTLVHGTSKGDGTAEILKAQRFRWFPSIKLWGVAQSRDHLAKRWQIQSAADAMRAAGFEVTVEIDDTPRDVAEAKADRADRLDARYDRLATRAQRESAEATARFSRAEQISERFGGGQPILVGHHSERSARADHKRMDQAMSAGVAAQDRAKHAAAAAAAVGSADAYRERPAVIIRRIDKTEAELRGVERDIAGEGNPNNWRERYYAPERKPAEGARLESLTARKTFLEHQLAADREALAEHEAAGYVRLTRESVHKGDLVTYWAYQRAEVVRVNAKTVSIKTQYTWTDKVAYNEIKSVECPHEDTKVTVASRKPPSARPKPAVTVTELPSERPEPLRVDARTECFTTPAPVVERMMQLSELEPGMTVLEPSAGLGAIARPVAQAGCAVDCVELDGQLANQLRKSGVARTIRNENFMEVQPQPDYDRVLMNPPFARQQDIAHVTHALRFLRPGGLLVAVMGVSAEFRSGRIAEEFRKLVADRGSRFEQLPADAFKMSGTGVRTIIAVIPG